MRVCLAFFHCPGRLSDFLMMALRAAGAGREPAEPFRIPDVARPSIMLDNRNYPCASPTRAVELSDVSIDPPALRRRPPRPLPVDRRLERDDMAWRFVAIGGFPPGRVDTGLEGEGSPDRR